LAAGLCEGPRIQGDTGGRGAEQATFRRTKGEIFCLTKRIKSEILPSALRWAMSPVHSPWAPSFRIRRRHVSPTTARLFPECSDAIGPKQVVQSPARTEDQRGSISDRATTDCPPASRIQSGNQDRKMGPVRNDAVAPPERANTRLVGIARLAASSPPAETRRKSAEKPEYFVLPVKSILNRCDSNRVPFEWTINPYRGCEFACKYCYAR